MSNSLRGNELDKIKRSYVKCSRTAWVFTGACLLLFAHCSGENSWNQETTWNNQTKILKSRWYTTCFFHRFMNNAETWVLDFTFRFSHQKRAGISVLNLRSSSFGFLHVLLDLSPGRSFRHLIARARQEPAKVAFLWGDDGSSFRDHLGWWWCRCFWT